MIGPAGAAVPRIELHCHLDCCVRLDTLDELTARRGLRHERPVRELAVAPPTPTSLVRYLRAIDVALDVLQTPEELARVAAELVEDWVADGVVHGEVRFAPQLHGREGLRMDDAVDAVLSGLATGRQERSISTSLLVCCLRHGDPVTNEAVADLAVRRRDVIDGIDLSGAEHGNPGLPHRRAFDRALEAGVPVTIHAGEAAGADSVREAIDVLGASRVGHGLRSTEDPLLVADLAARRITLECCPTSNVQTGATRSLAAHPIDRLRHDGVPVTVSTDGRTTSATDLETELGLLRTTFGWTVDDEREAQRNAALAAFVGDERRQELLVLLGD